MTYIVLISRDVATCTAIVEVAVISVAIGAILTRGVVMSNPRRARASCIWSWAYTGSATRRAGATIVAVTTRGAR